MQPHAIQSRPRPGIRRRVTTVAKGSNQIKAVFAAERHIQSVLLELQVTVGGRVRAVEIDASAGTPRVHIRMSRGLE